MHLHVPIEIFAALESELPALEKSLSDKLDALRRGENDEFISSVTIRASHAVGPTSLPLSDLQAALPPPTFWKPHCFRLFLSHSSVIKAQAHLLKEELLNFHVSGFVAHEDIEPTAEWEREIEIALETMDGLAALLSVDFPTSRWCDQEVGFAIGRRRLVIPVRLGVDPHGFLGKYQGLQGLGRTEPQVADELFGILLRREATRARMAAVLVEQFTSSASFQAAKDTMSLIERVPPKLTADLATRIRAAVTDNRQVREAFDVPRRADRLLARDGFDPVAKPSAVLSKSLKDDDIPF